MYTLALAFPGDASLLGALLADVLSSPELAEMSASGLLVVRHPELGYEPTVGMLRDWLRTEPTAHVLLFLYDKEPDEKLYERARRVLVMTATDIATRLGATAVMAHESGRAVLERRQGSYLLYSWFPECTDDVVLAHLRDPYRFTDARGMLP